MMTSRRYSTLPALPQPGPLDDWAVSIIVPQARTNLILNPSFETNTTNWAAVSGSIARSAAQQYHGAYSLEVTPTAANDTGATYSGALSLTSGVTYAVSLKIKGVAGVTYSLSVRTTGAVTLTERQFVATGFWQWIWLFYTETSSTSRRLYVTKIGTTTGLFYIDGVQVEACGSEGVFVTTYIDGDQLGLVPNQFPPAYLWMGTPHASMSTRSGQTRAGGRVLNVKLFGFVVSTILGLGLAHIEHTAIPFAQLDGAQYLDSRKTGRLFTLQGRWVGFDSRQLAQDRAALAALIDRDKIGTRQPLLLTAQHLNPDTQEFDGALANVTALYQAGLEGNQQYVPTGEAVITFTQYLPYIAGGDGGSALTVQQTVTNANNVIRRSPLGAWSALSTGMSGGVTNVRAMVQGIDGTLYIGGDFTDAGGSGADYLAAYDPNTNTFSVVGSATAINSTVYSLALAADGSIIIGGAFSNADGIAAADRIVRFTPGVGYSAIGASGADNTVFVVFVARNGDIYAGGSFLDIGGSGADKAGRWNGSAWSALASVTTFNLTVFAFTEALDGTVIVGGQFTNAGGIAEGDGIVAYNPTANTIAAMGSGLNSIVEALATGLNGIIYAGGAFTASGSNPMEYLAQWNGVTFLSIGNADFIGAGDVRTIRVLRDGTLLFGGVWNGITGVPFTDSVARWNGATFLNVDVDLPGLVAVNSVFETPDGTQYIGFSTSGSAITAAVTTLTNAGNAATYPRIRFTGPTSGTARLYQILNTTTNKSIFFNYLMSPGEVAILVLEPDTISFVSSFSGNLAFTILPGSQEAEFFLQPGANTISLYMGSATQTASMWWPIRYASLEETLQ